jgi:hypothetical protein
MVGMSRSRAGAWIALTVLAVSISAAAMCAAVACPAAATRSTCHPAPSAPRLTDCCAAHSSSGVAVESVLAAIAGPRVASFAVAPALAPVASGDLVFDPPSGRAPVVELFTLHRSLLL